MFFCNMPITIVHAQHANSGLDSNGMAADNAPDKLIALASIAAALHGVKEVAWGVSLAAKNAKVISAQAGDKGLGFRPITNFIDEISKQAMQDVNEISSEALKLSIISVHEQRSRDAYRRFDRARQKNPEAHYISSITQAMESMEKSMSITAQEFKKAFIHLLDLLESMDESMLSAKAIAAVSRIVTADTQEYRAKLEVVANNLEDAAVFIKEKVRDSYRHLNTVHKH